MTDPRNTCTKPKYSCNECENYNICRGFMINEIHSVPALQEKNKYNGKRRLENNGRVSIEKPRRVKNKKMLYCKNHKRIVTGAECNLCPDNLNCIDTAGLI